MIKKYTLKQLFALVDGRLTTNDYNEITEMITYICDCGLMSNQLPIAMDYIIEKNPIWFQEVDSIINALKIVSDDFHHLMDEIDKNYSDFMIDVPKLKDEFDVSDFDNYLIVRNRL